MALYWHVHHWKLFEDCWNYEERKAYILEKKPKEERELRLRLFKPVQNVKAIVPAQEAYDKAFALAWKDFDKVIDPAREALDKAIALVQEAYNKAVAPVLEAREKSVALVLEAFDKAVALVWETYYKAVDPAWEALNKAVVVAREAYYKVVAEIHQRECPDCPWNGKTIFP